MVETIEAKTMILVVGGDGQLGRSINVAAQAMRYSIMTLNRKELDITNKSLVFQAIESIKPKLVVN